MEDARTSTSSQRLSSTFDTLIESPEADIAAIPVVRPQSFPKGINRDIPVSVQELVYGGKAAGVGASSKCLDRCNELLSSSEEVHGPRKDRRTSEGLGPGEEAGPRKGQQPSGSSSSFHKQKSTSPSAKKGQANPKEKTKGQAKGKGKGKTQVEQALPPELKNNQERDDSHGQCVQYGKKSDGIQKQGGGKIEPIISKKVDLVKLVTHFETCNKEVLAKLNNFEDIQKKLGREILQVKESQKTMIVTLLNQPEYNSISFITRHLKELRVQVQNLEKSIGYNAALFQEQLEKSGKERLELKEDIQSIINNISLKNDLPRNSTPILDRNVLNLNNDLHHTISRNPEVDTACNFKEIPRLDEWPTFSGEGECNHMEFMTTIYMFKEDFNIPDEYISATLHSFFTKSAKKWY
ncbi:hypothetical protein O181_120613 [Austropuccinia psidii MF-1]|uniref:Uncharacterized protein n=1 Tax=Austropuccinia psidii MF-1 TaxID=1389203 RepID=A0A9Q3KGC2_9BASI|nr:hypothetical protein [Austropuccinia psidii MF-1]